MERDQKKTVLERPNFRTSGYTRGIAAAALVMPNWQQRSSSKYPSRLRACVSAHGMAARGCVGVCGLRDKQHTWVRAKARNNVANHSQPFVLQ
ncbi:unnamed protein product, partial [Ectocarpus sp. 6 AP-2014]